MKSKFDPIFTNAKVVGAVPATQSELPLAVSVTSSPSLPAAVDGMGFPWGPTDEAEHVGIIASSYCCEVQDRLVVVDTGCMFSPSVAVTGVYPFGKY